MLDELDDARRAALVTSAPSPSASLSKSKSRFRQHHSQVEVAGEIEHKPVYPHGSARSILDRMERTPGACGRLKSRRHPVSHHPVVAYILGGLTGGAAGLLFATTALEEGTFYPPAALIGTQAAAVAAIVGGVVVGWFLVALILSWAPGRIRCPRCGTSNRHGVASCRACQLPLN
jgi:hypothetical protein